MSTDQNPNPQPVTTKYVPPVLQYEPKTLDFGSYNPNIPLLQQPFITLHVRNTGGSTLIGRLIPQVSWLIINPIEFRCAPGESSEHALQISTGAPQNWNQKSNSHPHSVIISSNGGPAALDVSYTLDMNKQAYHPGNLKLSPRNDTRLHTGFLLPLAGILFFLMAIIGIRHLFGVPTPAERAVLEREQYLTQGAQTIAAQMGTLTPSLQSGGLSGAEATPTSLSVFAPLTTDTPDLTATAFHPTYTPWATDTFQNPESFISEYFQLLTERNYTASWAMLSRTYQEECCTALGTDPYYIYARDWDDYETITLISAYLQEYDRNPAPVQVRYQLKKYDEQSQEFTAMFWLIADDIENTLLIDVIDDLTD